MPSSTEPSIRLNFCFQWDCPRCQHVNYHRGVPAKLTYEEREEACDHYDIPIDCPLVSAPPFVTCCGCGAEFAAEDPSQGDEA